MNVFVVFLISMLLTNFLSAQIVGFDGIINVGTRQLASLYTGQISTRTLLSNTYSASVPNTMSRRWHFANDNVTSLQLVIPNFSVLSGVESTNAGTTSITASIEYPTGTFTQVKFGGLVTASVTAAYIISDPVTVTIPLGAVFYDRIFRSNVSGLSFSFWSVGFAGQPGISTGDNFNYITATDQTMSGSVTNASDWIGTTHFSPAAIIAQTRKPSVFLLGDSRVFGSADTYNASGDLGELARTIGPSFGYINAGIEGDRASSFISSHTSRLAISAYCSHVILELGVNDITGGRTSAQLVADRHTILGLFGSDPVFETTLPTETSSTDSWATTINQTPINAASVRLTFNTSVRAGSAGMAGFFDMVTQTDTTLSSSIWNVNGVAQKYTLDGVHESQFTNLAIQSAGVINTALFHRP